MTSTDLLSLVLAHPQFRQNRLPSLYSDFRTLSTLNPSGYRANISAWVSALSAATLSSPDSKLLLTTSDSLLSSLATREYGRPLALGVVIAEAVRSKELYPYDAFMVSTRSIHSWTYAGAVVDWALEKAGLKGGVPGRELPEGRWVVLKNVEVMAKATLQIISAKTAPAERVYTKELLGRELSQLQLSQTDLDVLIRYLSREMGEVAVDGNTLKFKSPHTPLTPVSAADTSIASLRALLSTLQLRTATLSANIEVCNTRAREALAVKNRASALAALKSRKTAEQALTAQLGALGQVEEVMSQIIQAASNIELISTLERSSAVLAGLNKEIGGTERVDRVMEGLREEGDVLREVNELIAEGGGVVDEGEVEDELEEMMREEKVSAAQKKDEEALAKTLEKLEIGGGRRDTTRKQEKREQEEEKDQRVPIAAE